MRVAVAVMLVTVVAGCGSGSLHSESVPLVWPHGVPIHVARYSIRGDFRAVFVGRVRLRPLVWTMLVPERCWTALGEESSRRARYEVHGHTLFLVLENGLSCPDDDDNALVDAFTASGRIVSK